ncbi:MAG: EamA family transporter [Rubrivivax sp.]
MDTVHLLAALASALLHAGWNAVVKTQPAPSEAMAAQMSAAALLVLPLLAWSGLPPPAAWPWVALSTALNVAAVQALLRAYASGGFGTVYPVMRATAVLGVALVSPLLLGERPSAPALAGLALVVAALALLALDTRRAAAAGSGFGPRAFGWTLLAGVLASAYVLADAQGARAAGSAVAYGAAVSVTNAIGMAAASRRLGAPWTLLRRHAAVAWPVAAASMLSYLLILWVFRHAPVAPAAALRDTSAVFAMLIAVLWLKEPLGPRRIAVLLLALAGVPLLRLG